MGRIMYTVYILTYRNNQSYISMVILFFFLLVRSKTDHIQMKLGNVKQN